MKRLFFLAALAVSVALTADARGQSSQLTPPRIGGYSSVIDPMTTSVQYTPLGGSNAMLTATGVGTFTVGDPNFLQNPAGPQTYNNATFTLTANTMSAAMSANFGPSTLNVQSGFSGNFSITQGGVNILSGSFTNSGELLQFSTAPMIGPIFFNVIPSGDFTSSIFLPTIEEQFSLRLTGGVPQLMASGGAFQQFTADGFTGDFNAFVIPEPATLAMAGLGVFVLPVAAGVIRRRRANRAG